MTPTTRPPAAPMSPFGRAVSLGGLCGAVVGAIWGLIEATRDYPLSGWIPVTFYVAVVGTVAGSLLGLFIGSLVTLGRRVRHPRSRTAEEERK